MVELVLMTGDDDDIDGNAKLAWSTWPIMLRDARSGYGDNASAYVNGDNYAVVEAGRPAGALAPPEILCSCLGSYSLYAKEYALVWSFPLCPPCSYGHISVEK